ncbi:hypothetical protein BS47DRAFT_487827 [Hydnum rufescens UP504]|uniref:Uncharacterized protein n=1 Tax=Hydnum rufescens UP504 TaxID=1448309 RepID=A0A9P6DPQ2_9AGAM|nr:hypothetical protein BS47DRAFT_487827 [Hydnum rufescens UP504]
MTDMRIRCIGKVGVWIIHLCHSTGLDRGTMFSLPQTSGLSYLLAAFIVLEATLGFFVGIRDHRFVIIASALGSRSGSGSWRRKTIDNAIPFSLSALPLTVSCTADFDCLWYGGVALGVVGNPTGTGGPAFLGGT